MTLVKLSTVVYHDQLSLIVVLLVVMFYQYDSFDLACQTLGAVVEVKVNLFSLNCSLNIDA